MSLLYKGERLFSMHFGPRLNDLVADNVQESFLNPNINKLLAPPKKAIFFSLALPLSVVLKKVVKSAEMNKRSVQDC